MERGKCTAYVCRTRRKIIHSPNDQNHKNDASMQIAIIAGGRGTRLGSLAGDRPKSMAPVLGKPFLEYQLEFLQKSGVHDIILCLGHLGNQIEEYFGNGHKFGVDIKYSFEDQPLDTAGAIKKSEHLLSEIFLTLYGDSYLSMDFEAVMSYFRARNELALMTVYRNHDRYDRSNTVVRNGLVTHYSKREKTPDMVYIEYGANIFRKEALKMVPAKQAYSMESLFEKLIEERELLAYEVNERFYEIGSRQGLAEFEQYKRVGR